MTHPVSIYIKDALRGARHLRHLGSHPGNGMALALIGAGALAGLSRAVEQDASLLAGLLVGGLIMASVIGPLWVSGSASRGRLERIIDDRRGADMGAAGTG